MYETQRDRPRSVPWLGLYGYEQKTIMDRRDRHGVSGSASVAYIMVDREPLAHSKNADFSMPRSLYLLTIRMWNMVSCINSVFLDGSEM